MISPTCRGNGPFANAERNREEYAASHQRLAIMRTTYAEVPIALDGMEAVAHALNTRPRKTLGWRTPAEAFNEHLLLLQQAGVATTD
ncbi:MAG: hypothetical protein WKF83_03580 [Nocardioidaceae bacterium]